MITAEIIKQILDEHVDEKFKDFTSGLIPGSRTIIGVRIPVLRKIAKEIAKKFKPINDGISIFVRN